MTSHLQDHSLDQEDYEILDTLGRGGMAQVYLVRHRALGTLHALKVLHLSSMGMRNRLLQEGRIQARLRHANLVPVTDLLQLSGSPALVMDYVDGPSLAQVLAGPPLRLDQADHFARQLLAGVATAHRHGMIHRDLKPENLLIDCSRPTPVLRITDFGLAKVLDAQLGPDATDTRSGMVMGTPRYMAPEQFRDAKNVDPRADIYSVGAILYQLVTGQPLYPAEDFISIYTRVSNEDYVDIDACASHLPHRMRSAIKLALRLDPAQRAQSADVLLQVWSDGAPTPTQAWSPDQVQTLRAASLRMVMELSDGPMNLADQRAPATADPTVDEARQAGSAPSAGPAALPWRVWPLLAVALLAAMLVALWPTSGEVPTEPGWIAVGPGSVIVGDPHQMVIGKIGIPAAPLHTVSLHRAEVAAEPLDWVAWERLGGENKARRSGLVFGIPIEELVRVLNAASVRDGLQPAMDAAGGCLPGNGYRIPTEAEWEQALSRSPPAHLERVCNPEPIPGAIGTSRVIRGLSGTARSFSPADPIDAVVRLARDRAH